MSNTRFSVDPNFDLEKCLASILATDAEQAQAVEKSDLQAADYMHFLREPSNLPLKKQIKIIDNCLTDPAIAENMTALCEFNADNLHDVLRQSAVWESRLQTLCARLHANHPDWTMGQLEDALRSVSNKFGGQPQSPAFKLELARLLMKKKDASIVSSKVREAGRLCA